MPSPSASPSASPEKKKTDPEAIKLFLLQSKYDPSALIDTHIRSIAFDTNIEANLLETFNLLHDSVSVLFADVEKEYNDLQIEAAGANKTLLQELDSHTHKLQATMKAVELVQADFFKASAEAVKIGEKLDVAEREKQRVDYGLKLMDFIRYFETEDPNNYENLIVPDPITKQNATIGEENLKFLMPHVLRHVDWLTISQVIHDLKKILYDINSDNVQRAQTNVMRLDQAIEVELLNMFDSRLSDLQDTPVELEREREVLVKALKTLSECLFMFNNGVSVQNRYLYSIVETRIPQIGGGDAADKQRKNNFNILRLLKKKNTFDDNSSAGETDDNDNSEEDEMKKSNYKGNYEEDDEEEEVVVEEDEVQEKKSGGLFSFFSSSKKVVKTTKMMRKKKVNNDLDVSDMGVEASASQLLNELFSKIISVCQEQFPLIHDIFPTRAVARVTRSLIQRIFMDPAFGLASRMENVLNPRYPKPPLLLNEYLDALDTVKTQLSALNEVLSEYCKQLLPQTHIVTVGGEETVIQISIDTDEEQLKSEEDVKRFLEDQIAQVLQVYMSDYFEKETQLVRTAIIEGLRLAVEHVNDPQIVSSGSLLILPKLRAEKLKTMEIMRTTVANSNFLNFLFNSPSEALDRMTRIAEGDKKLPMKLKDLYTLHESIVIEGVVIPIAQACKLILLNRLSAKPNNLPPQPPIEFISVLSFICNALEKLKRNFDDNFASHLMSAPTLIAACKESRRKATKNTEKHARDALHAWILCVGSFIENMLVQYQDKSDYFPRDDIFNDGKERRMISTDACQAVCATLLLISNCVHKQADFLHSLNLNESFWKPLGRQIVGVLISNIRKQKISQEGSKFLLLDIQDYYNVLQVYEAPENIDMMLCLREICVLYSENPEDVAKLVVEGLRHLDTSVVLAMLRSRSDSGVGRSGYWTRVLQGQYGKTMGDWENPLPWEKKKNLSIVAFSASAAAGSQSAILGPATLRKSAGFSQHYLSELASRHMSSKQEADSLSEMKGKEGFTIGDEIKASAAQNRGSTLQQRAISSSLRPEMSANHDNEQFLRFEQTVNNADEDPEEARNRLMMADYRDYGKAARLSSSENTTPASSALKAEMLKNAVFSFGSNITGKLAQMENAVKEGFDDLHIADRLQSTLGSPFAASGRSSSPLLRSSDQSSIDELAGGGDSFPSSSSNVNSNPDYSTSSGQASNSRTGGGGNPNASNAALSNASNSISPSKESSFMGKVSSLFKF